VAEGRIPGEARAADGSNQTEAVGEVDGLHVHDRGESGRDLRHVSQYLDGLAEGTDQRRAVRYRRVLDQGLAARLAQGAGVPQHLGGRLQQGTRLAVGAPCPYIFEFGDCPGGPSQLPDTLDGALAAALAHQPDHEPRHRARDVALVSHRAQDGTTQPSPPVAPGPTRRQP
jgi:hypothetical protein